MTTANLVELPELATRVQVAEFLQVSVPTVDRWFQEGRGPKRITLGKGAVRYRRADVTAFLDHLAETA